MLCETHLKKSRCQRGACKEFSILNRKAPHQSNDYNWLTTGLKNSQPLQSVQDQTQDYQSADWNGKETPYLEHEESQGYATTEQPQLEKRTTIPTTKILQSQYTTDSKSLGLSILWLQNNLE